MPGDCAGAAEMSKFKSHEEYDDWRSHRALRRQGAKDLKKMDAERPVYVAEKKRSGIGIPEYVVLAVVSIAGVLSFTASGREYLGGIVNFLSRLVH
jgi:hypothetical protein